MKIIELNQEDSSPLKKRSFPEWGETDHSLLCSSQCPPISAKYLYEQDKLILKPSHDDVIIHVRDTSRPLFGPVSSNAFSALPGSTSNCFEMTISLAFSSAAPCTVTSAVHPRSGPNSACASKVPSYV